MSTDNPVLECNPVDTSFIGLAGLVRQCFSGATLRQLAMQLSERVAHHPDDANALMDISHILQLLGNRPTALIMQAHALRCQRLYHLPATIVPAGVRLLAIMGPGDIKANMSVDLLLEGTDVALDMLYVLPGQPVSVDPCQYDVAIVAVAESDETPPLLQWIAHMVESWKLPVLNVPGRIGLTSRDNAYTILASAPGIAIPITLRITRHILERFSTVNGRNAASRAGISFPCIIRPVGSHAGHGLIKAEQPPEIADYLKATPDNEFYVAPFIDYRSPDGLFRKYRIALIDGRPFACHMAISEHWMIHYVNAGMKESPEKRAEEAHFMVSFDEEFAQRHHVALQSIYTRMQLDFLVIDCAETVEGRILIFEIDTGAFVHALDPVDIYPYKQPQMRKVASAFREMLYARIPSRQT